MLTLMMRRSDYHWNWIFEIIMHKSWWNWEMFLCCYSIAKISVIQKYQYSLEGPTNISINYWCEIIYFLESKMYTVLLSV